MPLRRRSSVAVLDPNAATHSSRRNPIIAVMNAFASLPITLPTPRYISFRKRSSRLKQQPQQLPIRASVNWPALSRRAHDTIEKLRRTTDPVSYEAALRRHVLDDPTNPFMWHALSKHIAIQQANVENDNIDAAIAVLREAVERVPPGTRGGLFEAWGTLEIRRGNTDLALRIFADAITTDPFAVLYVSLAMAQMRCQMVEEARETFRQGSRAYPTHSSLWRNWASLESQHGGDAAARDLWRTALRSDPTNARAWKTLVDVERRLGATSNTTADILHEALVSCPNDSELRIRLAKIEHVRKGPTSAKSILMAVEKFGDCNVLRFLGRIDFELGNIDSGRIYFRKAVDREAAGKDRRRKHSAREVTVRSLHAWALMEMKTGSISAARNILDEAKKVCSTDSGIWRAIAEIESRERNYDKAREAFEQAVKITPGDARLYLAWGRTESMAGNLERAEALINRVSKMTTNTGLANSANERSFEDDFQDEKYAKRGSPSKRASNRSERDDRNMSLTPHVLATALRERAILASRDGRLDDSAKLLTRASMIEPESETLWRLLATQELRLQGIESARQVYQRALSNVAPGTKTKLLHWWGQDERSCGNVVEARGLFKRATLANPEYMSAWMSWALMEKAEGSVREACRIFEKATYHAERERLRAPYVFHAWGRIEEMDRGDLDKARDIFSRGIQLAPKCGLLWTAWGLLEHRNRNWEKARDLFQKGTSSDPEHGNGWHSWALLEAGRCNFGRARDLFRRGQENEPRNSSLLSSWAMMEGRDLGNVTVARDLYEQAMTVDPMFAVGWHSWGCLEMNAGNINRAEELLLKASQIRSGDVTPWHTLGVLEADHRGNEMAGIQHWKRALEIEEDHALSYQSWALALDRLEKIDEARAIFGEGLEKVEGKGEDMGMLLQAWAGVEERAGNLDKARELLRKSLRFDRGRVESWTMLAKIEKERGLREEARQLLGEAIGEVSDGGPLYASLGSLEAEDGNLEHARGLFASGLAANPKDPGLWRAYAAMESRFGTEDRAERISAQYNRLFAHPQSHSHSSDSVSEIVSFH